jgi:protein gp37
MDIPTTDEPGQHNVFVCSMADLFGDWIPNEWIDSVFESIRKAPDWWNFILLTKNPARYLEVDIPKNCWVGATATNQKEMDKAISAYTKLRNKIPNVLFVSCEPLMGPISTDLSCLDWIIIGGRRKSRRMPEGQPKWEWVENLLHDSRKFDIKIYFKTNLTVRPEEFPLLHPNK